MSRAIYPGYTRQDWRTRDPERPLSTREDATAALWTQEISQDHTEGQHAHYAHPLCPDCEETRRQERSTATGVPLSRSMVDDAYDAAHSRAVRYLLLHGRLPAKPAESAEPVPFDAGTLVELNARPEPPPARCEGLIPAEAGTLLVAKRKAGKTTLSLGWARSLLTGEAFLGRFPTRPVAGMVAILNYEVSGHTLQRWATDARVPEDRLFIVNLRGRPNPLGDVDGRARLADLLRSVNAEALIVDTFARAFTGSSQNDAGEVGAWLADLDRFARGEVGATDLLLTAHTGWEGERTRGSSALEDWADAILTLTANTDGQRYLRAVGRDVELEEDRLDYDPESRTLTLSGAGSRHTAALSQRIEELVPEVVRIATENPGLSGGAITRTLREEGVPFQKGEEVKALAQAASRGLLLIDNGARNAKLYRPSPTLPTPSPPGGSPPSPTPLIGGRGGGDGQARPWEAGDSERNTQCPRGHRGMGAKEQEVGICTLCSRVEAANERTPA